MTKPTAFLFSFALLRFMLMTISRRRSWIGLLVLYEVSSVSVSRLLFLVAALVIQHRIFAGAIGTPRQQ